MTCHACSGELPPGARFCPSCGTSCAVADTPVERRKLVTTLFCDLVGSTELSGQLEPETLRSVVLRYFDAMRAQIEAHGGLVEKFIGDAVMAVFGVPTVHEDDARRAAAAALDMVAALADLNADLERTLGCRLAVRIGVNTGEVVATGADDTNENLVSGEVVNVAARLEQHAGPGEVLVGPTTRGLLGAAADIEEIGPLSLKGKKDAVTAYRLLGLPAYASVSHRTPFVGREREISRLRAAWSYVREGRGGRLLSISGEAGIGKTRLLQEWLGSLPAGAALVGTGRCHPYRDEASLTPLSQALRQILTAAQARGLRPALEYPDQVLRTGLLRDGTPGRSPESTYSAAAAVLRGLGRPVAVVIDDLHWADPTLLDAIAQLADQLADDRVLLVCSGRTGPSDVELSALSLEESEKIAAELVEVGPHGPSALTGVIERAEGNPLYLEHLLAMLDDVADPGELPVTVNAVLAARIDALPAAERTTLSAAAVVGRQFTAERVEALGSTGQLGNLVHRAMVEPAAGRYRFRSGLLREVAYRGISKRQRAEWHALLADSPDGGLATGAHHVEQAYLLRSELGLRDKTTESLRGRAAQALTAAGRSALSRADLSWSADLSRRALALSTKDDPWWAAAALGLGETSLALGRTDEGDRLLREVLASADQPAYAHAKLQLAALHPAADIGTAAAAAQEALPVFQTSADDLGLARAYVRLAQDRQLAGQHRQADELLDLALGHAVAAQAAPEQATALGAIGISLWYGPTPASVAIERCRELLDRHAGDHDIVMMTLNYPLANLYALHGWDAEAQACLAVANRFADGLGYAEAAVIVPYFSAGVEALAGRLDNAESLLRQTIENCQAIGHTRQLANAARELVRVQVRRGDRPSGDFLGDEANLPPAEAADQLGALALVRKDLSLARDAVTTAAQTDSPITRATAYADLAMVCRATGSPATGYADRAADLFAAKEHLAGQRAARMIGA